MTDEIGFPSFIKNPARLNAAYGKVSFNHCRLHDTRFIGSLIIIRFSKYIKQNTIWYVVYSNLLKMMT